MHSSEENIFLSFLSLIFSLFFIPLRVVEKDSLLFFEQLLIVSTTEQTNSEAHITMMKVGVTMRPSLNDFTLF